jgi:hypothetical protein
MKPCSPITSCGAPEGGHGRPYEQCAKFFALKDVIGHCWLVELIYRIDAVWSHRTILQSILLPPGDGRIERYAPNAAASSLHIFPEQFPRLCRHPSAENRLISLRVFLEVLVGHLPVLPVIRSTTFKAE